MAQWGDVRVLLQLVAVRPIGRGHDTRLEVLPHGTGLESRSPRRDASVECGVECRNRANSQPTLLRPLTSARTWELREDSRILCPNRGSRNRVAR